MIRFWNLKREEKPLKTHIISSSNYKVVDSCFMEFQTKHRVVFVTPNYNILPNGTQVFSLFIIYQ